jgi:hypothetical protein
MLSNHMKYGNIQMQPFWNDFFKMYATESKSQRAEPRAEPSGPTPWPALGSARENGSLPTSRANPLAGSARATFCSALLCSARPAHDARRACSALCQP